jgi:hypothetical protein
LIQTIQRLNFCSNRLISVPRLSLMTLSTIYPLSPVTNPLLSILLKDFRLEQSYIGEMAVLLAIVETVADDKVIG